MKRVQHVPIFQPKTSRLVMSICLVVVTSFEAGFNAFGGNNPPPSPDKPWRPRQSDESENALACGHFSNERSGAPIEIDSEKVYDLKELIDIAERTNPAMSKNSNAFIWQVFLLMSALTKGLVFGPIS